MDRKRWVIWVPRPHSFLPTEHLRLQVQQFFQSWKLFCLGFYVAAADAADAVFVVVVVSDFCLFASVFVSWLACFSFVFIFFCFVFWLGKRIWTTLVINKIQSTLVFWLSVNSVVCSRDKAQLHPQCSRRGWGAEWTVASSAKLDTLE